jgi:hypothetical protein
MADFSKYDIDVEKYFGKLPSYLQTPGNNITGQIKLLYDIMNNYKNTIVDLWSSFDINFLLNQYLTWRSQNPLLSDSEWPYTDLVEKICKTYDVIREHPEGLLRNSHMLRLLNIKTMGVGFDGTRERLEEILRSIFPENIRYIVETNNSISANANVFLLKNPADTSFDEIDSALFTQGYYFLKLLGITLTPIVVATDALIYDLTIYNGGSDDVDEQEANKYDGGSQ